MVGVLLTEHLEEPQEATVRFGGLCRVGGLQLGGAEQLGEEGDAEGFGDLMPQDLARKLTGEELDSVVAYVLSLN